MFDSLIAFIRAHFATNDAIPLHAPIFVGPEQSYVADAIHSTFVSSVGQYVDRFEQEVAQRTGSPRAVAVVNGTAALHVALKIAGVATGDLVITQPVTFVATCNAISYCGARPVFVDVDRNTMGMSPSALQEWLETNAEVGADGLCRLKSGGQVIRACLPMHTFGHPVDLDKLLEVCRKWRLALIEDAAESLGSYYKGRHTGAFGMLGTLSFNGNKVITSGGGGMILASEALADRAKHLTTTAKRPHPYEFVHDDVGYNYRLPNINAALGCAQLKMLGWILASKRALASAYSRHLAKSDFRFVEEPHGCTSNYWLNAVVCPGIRERNALLQATNHSGVMTRPIWTLMSRLPMYDDCLRGELTNAEWLEERVVNLPSSARASDFRE